MKLFAHGTSVSLDTIPTLSFGQFEEEVREAVERGASVLAFFALPDGDNGEEGNSTPSTHGSSSMSSAPSLHSGSSDPGDSIQHGSSCCLFIFLGFPDRGLIGGLCAVVGRSFPSLTPRLPQVHLFEREIFENTGIVPEGHPWLKPVRSIMDYEFYALEGGQTHEVAVGPVHAGVIEPGHFRFQCYGEEVEHLEIALGYQRRGIERSIIAWPEKKRIHLMETAAGDTTVGHALAYSIAIEALSGEVPEPRAEVIRGIALELERMANHIGDLGALAGDVGYLPTKSFCGRLRGEVLNLSAELCGNRFGRGIVRPGGVGVDIDPAMTSSLSDRLRGVVRDTDEAVDMLWDTPSVLARFERTGALARETALSLGLVGPAARACGIERDVRADYPTGAYRYSTIPVSVSTEGDVYARALVRMLEYRRSAEAVLVWLGNMPGGVAIPGDAPLGDVSLVGAPLENTRPRAGVATGVQGLAPRLQPNAVAVTLVEGWRGQICHCALTDGRGALRHYKIVDPSFHNWPGLAYALRGQQISDFPLCNKSFNLSYCGFDL